MKMKNNMKMKSSGLSGSGWHNESMRHSLAAKGIKSGKHSQNDNIFSPEEDPFLEDVYHFKESPYDIYLRNKESEERKVGLKKLKQQQKVEHEERVKEGIEKAKKTRKFKKDMLLKEPFRKDIKKESSLLKHLKIKFYKSIKPLKKPLHEISPKEREEIYQKKYRGRKKNIYS